VAQLIAFNNPLQWKLNLSCENYINSFKGGAPMNESYSTKPHHLNIKHFKYSDIENQAYAKRNLGHIL
jgi:hypothetical protein